MNVTLGRPLASSLIFAGLVIVSVAAVAASGAGLSGAVEERDAKADLLLRSVAASRRAALARAADPSTSPFVEADSQTLAAARIDGIIRAAALDVNAAVQSSRAEAKPDDGGIGGHIAVEAVIEGQNDALQAVLMKLESQDPVVLVDDLSMEPIEASGTRAGADPQAPRLRMTMTLGAYWKAVSPTGAPTVVNHGRD